MTGLDDGQLTDLVARVHEVCGERFVSRGRPIALGLFRSVAMVVCLLRKNLTQDLAGAVFGVSQPTVSRRWDLLRPVIGDVLAAVRPTPSEVAGRGTVLVDGERVHGGVGEFGQGGGDASAELDGEAFWCARPGQEMAGEDVGGQAEAVAGRGQRRRGG